MIICPNCKIALSEEAELLSCPKCNADFSPGSAWKPVDPQQRAAAEMSTPVRAAAMLIGGVLVIHGLWLLYRAFTHPYNPGAPAVFGMLSLFIGSAICASRTRGFLGLTLILGAVLVVGFLLRLRG